MMSHLITIFRLKAMITKNGQLKELNSLIDLIRITPSLILNLLQNGGRSSCRSWRF